MDDFWKILRDELGFGNVDPENEALLEIMEALEEEGVSREKARLAVLAAAAEGRAEQMRTLGSLAARGAKALWDRFGKRRTS